MRCCRWISAGSPTSRRKPCSPRRSSAFHKEEVMRMRVLGSSLLAAALAMQAGPARAQGTFEGTVTGSFVTEGKTIPFRYSQLGSRVRQEYTVEGNTAVS